MDKFKDDVTNFIASVSTFHANVSTTDDDLENLLENVVDVVRNLLNDAKGGQNFSPNTSYDDSDYDQLIDTEGGHSFSPNTNLTDSNDDLLADPKTDDIKFFEFEHRRSTKRIATETSANDSTRVKKIKLKQFNSDDSNESTLTSDSYHTASEGHNDPCKYDSKLQ